MELFDLLIGVGEQGRRWQSSPRRWAFNVQEPIASSTIFVETGLPGVERRMVVRGFGVVIVVPEGAMAATEQKVLRDALVQHEDEAHDSNDEKDA